jgi:acetylornithine and succinylornithine aminotransferases
MTKFDVIKERDNKFFMNTYSPYDIAFVSGDGCTLRDSEGNKYMDFLAGIAVNSLGYNHPVFVKAVSEQAKKLTVVSNYYYSEERGKLAEKLVEGTSLGKVFFGNSGAEANECSIKLARKYFYNKGVKKFKFVTAKESFHGRTLATVSATGQPKYNKPFAPLPEGFGTYIPYNDIDALEKALSDQEVSALLIEPVQGEGGVIPGNPEYIKACRDITKKNGQLLIFDEVQTGGGRTGKFWAFEHYGVTPDIMSAAKGIGGGFPVSACLATDEVASAYKSGDHGTTFGAAPFACAVSLAVVSEIKKPGFMERVTEVGAYLKARLSEIKNPAIKEVRGLGLMVGMDLDETLLSAKEVVMAMHKKGFVLNVSGHNVLRFIPALIITKKEIDIMIEALDGVIGHKA